MRVPSFSEIRQAANGDYNAKRVVLEIYDEMAEAMKTAKPYQTRLDPFSGPPADAGGNFLPLPQWLPGKLRSTYWPLRIHPPCSHLTRHVRTKMFERKEASK